MSIKIKDSIKCENCLKECLQNCPNNLTKIECVRCAHCDFANAPCIKACKQNAFTLIGGKIIAINEEKCNGCKECINACPLNAIELINGKAKKCDLCFNNNFERKCINLCIKNNLEFKRSENEIEKIEKILGWRHFIPLKSEILEVLKEGKNFKILKLKNGKLLYSLTYFPEFSIQEIELIGEILRKIYSGKIISNKSEVVKIFEKYCNKNFIILNENQKKYLTELVWKNSIENGIISCFLENDSIEEITVNGIGIKKPIFVYEREFGWLETNSHIAKNSSFINIINKMSSSLERRISFNSPLLNATNKNSRISALLDPIVFNGKSLTIRNSNLESFDPFTLVRNNALSIDSLCFLSLALKIDTSLLVSGNTGSGKTTTLNSLLYFIPPKERLIIVEETPEINPPHKHFVKLCVSNEKNILMEKLISQTLRMRPDRIIVSELREKNEVYAFINTLLSGQGKGSYATFHSQSTLDAIQRLLFFGINPQDIFGINLIITQKRIPKIDSITGEVRRVTQISEIFNKKEKIGINKLFEYNYKKDFLEKKNESKIVKKKICEAFNFSSKKYLEEINKIKIDFTKKINDNQKFKF